MIIGTDGFEAAHTGRLRRVLLNLTDSMTLARILDTTPTTVGDVISKDQPAIFQRAVVGAAAAASPAQIDLKPVRANG